ncbi:hypothetical protein JCM10213_008211 [Rhodosporidiobolus nylandii]
MAARPVSPPSAWSSPGPSDPLLHASSTPAFPPPRSTIALSPNPNDYGHPDDDDEALDEKEIDRAIALLERRERDGGAGMGASGAAAGAAGARRGTATVTTYAHAVSRKFAQRNFSRRALLAAIVVCTLLVSLLATVQDISDGQEAGWRGRVQGAATKARERVASGVRVVWSQTALAHMLQEDGENEGPWEPLDVLKVLNFDTPRETLREQLKPGVRYVTAMAYGGHANQLISIGKMLYFAKITNRVGIIPTLIPIHIDGPPVPISTFYDLDRFWSTSRIPAVEFSAVKPLDLQAKNPQNEHLSCWSVQESTVGFANLEAWSFDLHDIWVDHWPLPPLARGLGGFDLAFDALRVFDFDQWAKQDWIGRVQRESLPQKAVPKNKDGTPGVFSGDKTKNLKDGFDTAHTTPPNDQLVCFDNTLFLGPVMFPELPVAPEPLEPGVPGEGLSWMNVGQYLRFNADVEQRADEYLMKLFGVSSPAKIPPFITVHLRRGDFKDFAGFTSLDKYISALQRVRTSLQARLDAPDAFSGPGRAHFRHFGLKAEDYAVVATTDEDGQSEFVKEVRALGWKVLDHGAGPGGFKTKETMGGWWPTMLDGAILARGRSFVGTDRSTFSHLAGLRVKYWRGGLVEIAT